MTEPRRVRTQVERDADGTTWRPPRPAELPDLSGILRVKITSSRPPRRRWWHSHRREITRIRAESRRLLVRMYYDRLTRRNP